MTSPATTQELLAQIDELRTAVGEALAADAEQVLLPAERLSDAERRLVPYVLGSLQTSEIARVLHLSPNTVKTQLKAVYRKLGVHSRSEARLKLQAVKP